MLGRRGPTVVFSLLPLFPRPLTPRPPPPHPPCLIRHKATIHRLIQRKEAKLEWKRRRVPGMPDVALQDGRGTLAPADIMVTWVTPG